MKRNILNLLIVEDEPTEYLALQDLISKNSGLNLCGIATDSKHAIDLIQDCCPDVIILDLELHKGNGNGIYILNELQQLDLCFKPYILITTNNSSPVTLSCARSLGADFIISKHEANYSAETVLDFINIVKDNILSTHINAASSSASTKYADEEAMSKRIRKRIVTELNNVGINPKSKGYGYLIEAIQLLLDKSSVPNISDIIAKRNNKTSASVARAMQNAINKAWNTYDIEELLLHYTAKINSNKGVPTLTEFLYFYAEKINTDYY